VPVNDARAGTGGREPELPPGVRLAQADVARDPDAAEARGAALMASSATAIIDGVEHGARPYARRRATELLDAWGQVAGEERARALDSLDDAASRAARRVLDELRALFARDAAEQRRTPLEIVRTVRREPSEVLAALGVPSIVRDPFEERSLPDDPYGLAPRSLADLGDAELGAMQLAWGVGKATVVRARAARSAPPAPPADKGVENLSTTAALAVRLRGVLGTIGRATTDAVARVFRRSERAR
jgi:hypothetical protein